MSRYVCPCEGSTDMLRDPDALCDDAAYPPKGIPVCRRHGVDPCHDDAWHAVPVCEHCGLPEHNPIHDEHEFRALGSSPKQPTGDDRE